MVIPPEFRNLHSEPAYSALRGDLLSYRVLPRGGENKLDIMNSTFDVVKAKEEVRRLFVVRVFRTAVKQRSVGRSKLGSESIVGQ